MSVKTVWGHAWHFRARAIVITISIIVIIEIALQLQRPAWVAVLKVVEHGQRGEDLVHVATQRA